MTADLTVHACRIAEDDRDVRGAARRPCGSMIDTGVIPPDVTVRSFVYLAWSEGS